MEATAACASFAIEKMFHQGMGRRVEHARGVTRLDDDTPILRAHLVGHLSDNAKIVGN